MQNEISGRIRKRQVADGNHMNLKFLFPVRCNSQPPNLANGTGCFNHLNFGNPDLILISPFDFNFNKLYKSQSGIQYHFEN
jgi:hypothetical protein